MIRDVQHSVLRERPQNECDTAKKLAEKPTQKLAGDEVEQKENSVGKAVDFVGKAGNCAEDARVVRRKRTVASVGLERRFKGSQAAIPKVALQLLRTNSQEMEFFRCYQEREVAGNLPMQLPETSHDDDCDTDEESASTLRASLLAHLLNTLLPS